MIRKHIVFQEKSKVPVLSFCFALVKIPIDIVIKNKLIF